jgi:GldM C-terminal domain
MTKFLFFCCASLFVSAVFAQKGAVIGAVKSNLLLIGPTNPISIAVPNVPIEKVSVEVSQGSIERYENGKGFSWRVTTVGKAILKIFVEKDGSKTLYQTDTFRVKTLPNPIVVLRPGGETDRIPMGVGELKAQRSIIAEISCCECWPLAEVVDYTLKRVNAKGEVQEAKNIGARFGTETRALLEQAETGDKFYFINIRARNPGDTTPRNINDLIIAVR